jgi:hypothetical protein
MSVVGPPAKSKNGWGEVQERLGRSADPPARARVRLEARKMLQCELGDEVLGAAHGGGTW